MLRRPSRPRQHAAVRGEIVSAVAQLHHYLLGEGVDQVAVRLQAVESQDVCDRRQLGTAVELPGLDERSAVVVWNAAA